MLTTNYSLDEQRKKALNKLTVLQSLILSANSSDAIVETTKHISNAVSVLKVLENQTPPQVSLPAIVRKRPANALPDKQFRYESNKKKKPLSVGLCKPSHEEVQKSKQQLNEVDVKVCAICFKEDDNHCGNDIDWVQCFTCASWFHVSCSEMSQVVDLNEFICSVCSSQ